MNKFIENNKMDSQVYMQVKATYIFHNNDVVDSLDAVRRYFETHHDIPKEQSGKIARECLDFIVKNPTYLYRTGLVDKNKKIYLCYKDLEAINDKEEFEAVGFMGDSDDWIEAVRSWSDIYGKNYDDLANQLKKFSQEKRMKEIEERFSLLFKVL